MIYRIVNEKYVALRSLKLRELRVALPVLSILALLVSTSFAYAEVQVPSSVSPGQVEKRLNPQEIAPSNQLKLELPSPAETQTLSDVLRAQLEKNKFTLKGVSVEGATVQDVDINSAYDSQIGQTISLLDAREIAARITASYRNKGYILSLAVVPTQDVTNGMLKIRVVEGYIGNVLFIGDATDGAERAFLGSYAEKMKALRPAKMADLERTMLLMNDLPGTTITGLIRPSPSAFGSADLVLTVRRNDLDASYTFDNRGSKYLGPWQHTFSAGVNSLINAFDYTRLRVMTAMPFKELFGAQLEHEEILNDEGTKLSLLGSHTRTQPGDSLKSLHVVGHSDLLEARISHPFLRMRQQSFVARGVFDVHNTSTDVFSHQALTRDRLRIARVGGNYRFLDQMFGSNSLDIQLSQGLNIFDATDHGAVRSNPIGKSDFTKGNFDFSRLQPLPESFSVLTSATGQYSFDPLLTDEQFSLGGPDFGRAFDPAEVLGDSGLGGKIELRYDGTVSEPYLDSFQLFTFFDIGEVWTRGSDEGSDTVSSTGLGARLKLTEYLFSSVEADFPVIKPINDQTSYRHSPRLFFTLSMRY